MKYIVLGLWALQLLFSSAIASRDIYAINEEVGEKLNHYLQYLSTPKPLKCEVKVPKSHRKWSEALQWFRSRQCQKNERWNAFQFSGKINELDQFEGPGKFILGNDETSPSEKLLSVCFETANLGSGIIIENIIGTFVNGTLEGNAKVTFSNKQGFIIANFVKGVPHGLKRTFTASKSLIKAEVVSMNVQLGYYWSIRNKTNYILDFTHTNETLRQMDLHQTLVFISSSNKFLGGSYSQYMDMIFDPYTPESLNFNEENSGECIKVLGWTKTTPVDGEVYSLRNASLVSELPEQSFFSSNSQLSAPERLIRFRKYLLDNEALEVLRLRKTLPPINKEERVPFLDDILKIEENTYEALLNGEKIRFQHTGGFSDDNDRFHGFTYISIINATAPDKIFNTSISKIWAEFHHGKIKDGLIKLQYADMRRGFVNVNSNTIHGPLIIHGAVPILPVKFVLKPFIFEMASTILTYNSGRMEGPFWIAMFGLGTLTGHLNETGYVTGNKISYLYPDMETSYIGKFENKIMREGYLGDVINVSFDGPIPSLDFKMSTSETRPFYYEPPTNVSTGSGPEILDPYDQKRVYLSDAGEFGEGVHVKVDMEVGDIACLYNYHMYYPPDLEVYKESCMQNKSKSDDERRHCSKYALGMQYVDASLNIPPEKDVPGMFLPTLGQKLNHKFYESHASFVDFESPRWGLISSIGIYFKPIKKGEQLYVDYGYSSPNNFPYDFPWFWELKSKVDEERKKEKLKEKKKLLKKQNQAAKKKKKKSKNN